MLADQSLALCCILFGKTQLQVHIGNALAAARPIQEQVHHPPQNHSQAAPYAQRQVRQHFQQRVNGALDSPRCRQDALRRCFMQRLFFYG